MTTKYDEAVRLPFKDVTQVKFDRTTDLERLIIDSAGERELADAARELNTTVQNALADFVREKMRPKLQFTHVKEAGIRIWGRRENLAISKFTMSQVLHEVAAHVSPERLEGALCRAGSKSALQFFADFIPLLKFDRVLQIPENEMEFLGILQAFDLRSAWWSEMPQSQEETGFEGIMFKEPFTTFPWCDNDPHGFTAFLGGYTQTLFNCASEFLRHVHWALDKNHRSRFAVHCEFEDKMSPERVFLKLFVTDKYVQEFDSLDHLWFYAYREFLSASGGPYVDLSASPEYYKELVRSIKGVFGEDFRYDTDIFRELAKRRKDAQTCHQERPDHLILEMRLDYQTLKIERLMKLDEGVQEAIRNARRDVT